MSDLTRLNPHELFLVAALDGAMHPDIQEIRFDEIVGLTGEFTPKDLIEGFAPYPERIADLLEKCVGTKRTIGRKTKPATAIDNLTDALTPDEKTGEVASSPEELYEVVTSQDLVNHQDAKRIWSLLFRHRWTGERSEKRTKLAALLLASIQEHKLLSPQEIVETLGTEQLMGDNMPAALRKRVLDLALKLGRPTDGEGKTKKTIVFDDQQLLVAVKAEDLAQHIELPILERVFAAVAKKFQWVEKPKPLVPPPEQTADDDAAMTNPPPPATDEKKDDGEPELEVTPGEAGAILLAADEEAPASDAEVDAVIDGIKREGEPGKDFEVEDPMHVRGQDGVFRPRKEGSGANPFPKPGSPPPLPSRGKSR